MQQPLYHRFILQCIAYILLIIGLHSCKSLDTTVSVPTRPIPQSFASIQANLAADTTTIAILEWRRYFQDSVLTNLIDTALKNNFDLRIALQRIEIAEASLKAANGAMLPQVQAGIGAGVRKFGLYTMDGAGNATTDITSGQLVPVDLPDFSIVFQTTWEADIWGKLRSRSASAQAQYLAGIEGTRFLVTSLIAEIATAYYELCALDHELNILRRTLQKQQEALGVIQLQKSAARTNELAVQQFEAQVLNTQALEQETLQNIVVLENRVNFLAGRYPQVVERRKEILLQTLPEQIASGIPSHLLANRPDIREAELLVKSTQFETEFAKAAFFPSLTLSAGIGFQAFDPQFLFASPASLIYNVLGGLVAPLVNWQGLEAQFSVAKSQQIQALTQYQQTIVNGYVETVNALSAIEKLRRISALKNQQARVLTQSVETATDLYKSAKATYLEVLLAQENALQSQLDLINVQKRQRIVLVNLYKALGGGWR